MNYNKDIKALPPYTILLAQHTLYNTYLTKMVENIETYLKTISPRKSYYLDLYTFNDTVTINMGISSSTFEKLETTTHLEEIFANSGWKAIAQLKPNSSWTLTLSEQGSQE